jgi:glyceraldehyde 3-phosphate dehydrogenase
MTTINQTAFQTWIEKEKKALELITIVGHLSLERSIELVLFRKPLVDLASVEVLAAHQHAREISDKDISIYDTLEIAKAIKSSHIAPSRIDLGKLAVQWIDSHHQYTSVHDFVTRRLAAHIGKNKHPLEPKDIVLYGFGRIGRLVAREIISQTGKGEQLRLKAVVVRSFKTEDLSKRANLFKSDSIHHEFKGTITIDDRNNCFVVNGQRIHIINGDQPEEIDYTNYDINNALLIDSTGILRDRVGLNKHLNAKGISKVLLTAPGKGDLPNIVAGINDKKLDFKNEHIFTCASCTTNAIVPVLQLINDTFKIQKGHVETIRAYTNDQNLLDNYHRKERRGRSAALNMVITETGAANAVAKVIPNLAGKLTGSAVRVPVPNGSLAILNLSTHRTISPEKVEETLKNEALFGELSEQIDYSISKELVSSDIIGNSHTAIIDGPSTIIGSDSKSLVLYVWYDNEYGYSKQVVRLAKKIAGVVRLTYY